MLFPYTYVPHKMGKMQEFIDFIFYEVWCKAPVGLEFHPDIFSDFPELQIIMSTWGFSVSAPDRGKLFYKDVKDVYQLFAVLSPPEIKQFREWYRANNDIEKACANDLGTPIVRYEELIVLHPDLSKKLASFFKDLYTQSLLDLAALRAHIGDIDDHYHAFVQVNNKGKCPFCGMGDLLGEYHTKREAYDHYLPKAHYPFNSINFHNLAPACHHCNSSYKTSKDPAHQPKHPTHAAQGNQRRRVFYPFTTQPHAIEIQVDLRSSDVMNLEPEDVALRFGPAQKSDEIQTWLDVYGIDERYKAKICTESDGKAWLVEVLDEWNEGGRDPSDYMRSLTRHERKNPWADCRFLKKPFLEACERVGLFTPVVLPSPKPGP